MTKQELIEHKEQLKQLQSTTQKTVDSINKFIAAFNSIGKNKSNQPPQI
ncbi:hypothetical protein SAMN05421863_10282 [Nitrosomonas communis]|uniref:Uncharacterized protein n=1 Tax=Nitrosomonas communis TaxID=44574 RepID=A0A1I4QPW1_9PROT|nr:hypothetical protein SAMN05421863_10282 [Nitrosomonas communis]